MEKITAENIYKKYERGQRFHEQNKIYTKAKKCVRLYEGEQWFDETVNGNKDNLPFYNFTKSIVDYKTAMVAKNNLSIVYNPLNCGENRTEYVEVCKHLNCYAEDRWEHLKMDSLMWDLVKNACICGDCYIYFANKDLFPQLIDNCNIYFADEQEKNIQNQKYIIIAERKFVSDIKAMCKNKQDAARIVADTPENQINNDDNEVQSDDGKVTSLLYLYKNEHGSVCFVRATKSVIYDYGEITGLNVYPVAAMVWARKQNSSRGLGEVWNLRANQITTNKTLYRRDMAVKSSAFPKPVYVKDAISDPSAIMQIGAAVELDVDSSVDDINKMFGYVSSAPISNDAKTLQDEIMSVSRDLSYAGDNATGNMNPENASGKAIQLVVDQNAMLLTEQSAVFKQCVEDIGLIWFGMWKAYNPDFLRLSYADDESDEMVQYKVPGDVMNEIDINVRVDVTPSNAWTVYQNDQEALNLLANNFVTFDEYVELLTDGNAMKGKLQSILKNREAKQQEAQMMQAIHQQAMEQQAIEQQSVAQEQAMAEQQAIAKEQAIEQAAMNSAENGATEQANNNSSLEMV